MKKTILVVDDFKSIRLFVCDMLQKKGYQTLGAANGEEALEVLSKNQTEINLVLTDYNMPGCSGLELLQKIKGNPDTKNVPVIFLTTELDPDKIKKAKENGLAAWIKKPYKSEVFFSQIESSIN